MAGTTTTFCKALDFPDWKKYFVLPCPCEPSTHLNRIWLLLLLLLPPPLTRCGRQTLGGPVGGLEGRHDCVASHVLQAGRNGTQPVESGLQQGRALQQDVPLSICLLPADRAEGRRAAMVLAPVAGPGGGLPDPVPPLGRAAGPVARPQ